MTTPRTKKKPSKKKAPRKRPGKKKAPALTARKLTARNADRHVLYQKAVQDPQIEINYVSRVFKRTRGRTALSLREDFCGTALLCAHWIKSNPQRTALGIDLDPSVLAWGRKHNLEPVGEPGKRIRLLEQDVRDAVKGPFDLAMGFNFSWWIFKTRADLLAYFKSVHRSLAKDGMFFMDTYGGWDAMDSLTETRRVKGGFTYIWDQAIFNPIDHHSLNHIHFRFPDGSKMNKAFTYDWRLWTLPEVKELLTEAGFKNVTIYWEGDGDGDGDGVFRPKKVVDNQAAWIAYIAAER